MRLQDKIELIKRTKHKDTRGWFLKAINGTEENLPGYTGEVYITVAKPNETRGGHYHNLAKEWFTLLHGKCIVKLFDTETHERLDIELDEESSFTLYIPERIAHLFVNNDPVNDFTLLAYTDQLYNPSDTITFEIA